MLGELVGAGTAPPSGFGAFGLLRPLRVEVFGREVAGVTCAVD